jgi:hypothetical protein
MSNPAHSLFVVTLYRYAAAYADPRRQAGADQPGRSLVMRFEPQNRTEVELAAGATAVDALEVVLADRIVTAARGALVDAFGENSVLGFPAARMPRIERFAVEAMVMPERPTDGRAWEASQYVATVDVDKATIRVEPAASETDAAWTAALDRLRRGVS